MALKGLIFIINNFSQALHINSFSKQVLNKTGWALESYYKAVLIIESNVLKIVHTTCIKWNPLIYDEKIHMHMSINCAIHKTFE